MSNTPHIELRPFQLSDCDSIAYHANNRLIWERLRDRFPFPYTKMDAIMFIEIVSRNHPITEFAIDIDGTAIGAAGIVLKDDVYKLNGEIGYWIGQEYWGNGIGTKVVADLTRKAFEDFNLKRVYAEVFENNLASERVLVKNGFNREAILKDAIIKDGKILNLLIYSKLKD